MHEDDRRGLAVRKLASGAFILFVARVVAMGLGLAQALLIATKFGTSATADAFFVGYAVCVLFVSPTETGLMMAFVPAFVHTAEKQGEDTAWKVAASLAWIGLGGMAGAALLLASASPLIAPVVAPGFDAATVSLVAHLIRVLSPIVVLVFVASLLSTLDYVAGRYLVPGVAMTVNAMAGPVSLLLFADRYGIVSLAWGLVIGGAVRCVMLFVGSPHARRLLGPAVPLGHPVLREIGRTIVARVLTTWFIEVNLMVDRMFASFLGPGYVSYLAYASRAVMAVVNTVMMPTGRVIMPALSRLAAQRSYERLRMLLGKGVMVLGCLVVPVVVFIAIFRVDLLTVVFRRGAFDASSVEATAYALLFYSLGIVPFLLAPALNGTFFALGETAVPLKIGIASVVANALLDAALLLPLGHGGIALSSSLVGAIRATLLWLYLRRRIGALPERSVLSSLLTSVASATVAFWTAQVVVSAALGGRPLAPLWRLAAYGGVGGAAYLALQAAFNRPVVALVPRLLGRSGRPPVAPPPEPGSRWTEDAGTG
jgi:putative peptidoglycan lipid II flippase